jgi:hypothetical protein
MHAMSAAKFSDVFEVLHKDGRLREPSRWRLHHAVPTPEGKRCLAKDG